MRADARRNHACLLAEARIAFAKHGAGTSLEEIAHRAGVGSGTLYRHFPTREALLEAVLRDWTESMQTEAEGFLAYGSPSEALHAWLRSYLSHLTLYRGLATALMASMQEKTSALYVCGQSVKKASADLLTRAQAAGEIRSDADITDVLRLVKGIAAAVELPGGSHGLAERLLAIVMDGLRAQPAPDSVP
jgi:AcrR family transcriptional regulator